MNTGRVVTVVALLLAAGGALGALSAQGPPARPLSPAGAKNLTFGVLFPGVPTQILPTDAVNAGRYDIRGTNRAEVQVTFTLPAVMTGPVGATMTLVFGAADGGFSQQNTISTAQVFDPRVPLITRLSNGGRLYIWLGGTVQPSGTQRSGTYTAVVTLTAAYTGN